MIKSILSRVCRFLAASFDGNIPQIAIFFMRVSSALGNSWSQNNLAVKYLKGDGVAQDLPCAAALLKLAADQESVEAFLNLAWMYLEGVHFSQDYSASIHWYELAARKGHPVAKYNLGWMIFNGMGAAEDQEAGLALIVEARKAGLDEARIFLENINRSGLQPKERYE